MKWLQILLLLATLTGCGTPDRDLFTIEGGHNYLPPSEIRDSGFLALPIKDKVSRSDSFRIGYYGDLFFKNFDEDNLSIRPLDTPVFRLIYDYGPLSLMKPIVIKLKATSITVKEGIKGSFYPWYDTSRLTGMERFHYRLLSVDFPLADTNIYQYRRARYDSLINIYPELDDSRYYKELLHKATTYDSTFAYKTTSKTISYTAFKKFIGLVNRSNFWSCSFNCDCQDMAMDAPGFSLEANTPQKYQLIRRSICPDDTSKIIDACYELIRIAGLESTLGNKIRYVTDTSYHPKIEIREVEMEKNNPEK